MNILIKETRAAQSLELMKNGVNWVVDLIGNYGALNDGQFTYDADLNVYVCDQDTFNWWAKVVADKQALDDRLAQLREEHGSDAVEAVLGRVGDYDLEDEAAYVNKYLDEEFGAA
ncbi:hypothetical protein [Paenibacillus sp. EPM92]|uniref:hypothetical protein n=1 Tax=Paenibacillus sp. EPM92 TaxID=1561195 RepID=UPI001915AC7E|nr:hypothetical protein [Paenibacillus sp. EPM92]